MNHALRLAAFLSTLVTCGGCATQAANASVASTPVADNAGTSTDAMGKPIHLEAEDAQLTGAKVLMKRDGYLGQGYVSGLANDGDNIKWTVNADKAGIYEARLRYSSPFDDKETELVVNGDKTSTKLTKTGEKFADISLGKVQLKQGANSVVINKGWGYYDVDAIDFVPVGAATAPQSAGDGAKLHLEAEDAKLTGAKVETKRAGFSGTGYISGFTKDGDNISWTLPVEKAGIYEVRVRYSSPNGEKGTEIVVNGVKTAGKLPKTEDVFATTSLGKVELKAGDNQIAINKGWGYYDIDALDFVAGGDVAAIAKPPATLTDAKATPAARFDEISGQPIRRENAVGPIRKSRQQLSHQDNRRHARRFWRRLDGLFAGARRTRRHARQPRRRIYQARAEWTDSHFVVALGCAVAPDQIR